MLIKLMLKIELIFTMLLKKKSILMIEHIVASAKEKEALKWEKIDTHKAT